MNIIHCFRHIVTKHQNCVEYYPLFETHCDKTPELYWILPIVRNTLWQNILKVLNIIHCLKHIVTDHHKNIDHYPLFETHCDKAPELYWILSIVWNTLWQTTLKVFNIIHCLKHIVTEHLKILNIIYCSKHVVTGHLNNIEHYALFETFFSTIIY
jgi:hypothetical protein